MCASDCDAVAAAAALHFNGQEVTAMVAVLTGFSIDDP